MSQIFSRASPRCSVMWRFLAELAALAHNEFSVQFSNGERARRRKQSKVHEERSFKKCFPHFAHLSPLGASHLSCQPGIMWLVDSVKRKVVYCVRHHHHFTQEVWHLWSEFTVHQDKTIFLLLICIRYTESLKIFHHFWSSIWFSQNGWIHQKTSTFMIIVYPQVVFQLVMTS